VFKMPQPDCPPSLLKRRSRNVLQTFLNDFCHEFVQICFCQSLVQACFACELYCSDSSEAGHLWDCGKFMGQLSQVTVPLLWSRRFRSFVRAAAQL
jgi:hypothetical protein